MKFFIIFFLTSFAALANRKDPVSEYKIIIPPSFRVWGIIPHTCKIKIHDRYCLEATEFKELEILKEKQERAIKKICNSYISWREANPNHNFSNLDNLCLPESR